MVYRYNKQQKKEYYNKNKERIEEYRKKYSQENKEKINQKAKERYYKNREKRLKQIVEWRKKNKDKVNQYQNKNYHKHKSNKKFYARYLANRKIKIPKNQMCEICNKMKAIHKHHKDYLKPLEVRFLCLNCHQNIK